MSEKKIDITIKQLQQLLDEQKRIVGEYMTRNLSVYCWWPNPNVDLDKAKNEMLGESLKAGFPDEFNVLKKYMG